jgi:hemerythrin-like metal-binding protein
MPSAGQRPLLIIWNESFLTGVDIIDEQHRGIVSIINSLHFAQPMPNACFLQPTAAMIMGYTQIHFATEIMLLKEAAYPRLQEQMHQHDQLIAEADRLLQAGLKNGGDPGEFLDFLKDWWQVHIMHEDMAYSGFMRDYFLSPHRVIVKKCF